MRPPWPGPAEPLEIALVSEHASPLAALGGADAGGQNVHVAQLAGQLAERGHRVTVYTRRDCATLPRTVRIRPGLEIRHVPAGPAHSLPKDELLPHMPEFSEFLEREWTRRPPHLAHAHFWMSGIATWWATRALGIPFVHTFHALGSVKRRHQGAADTSPPGRIDWERQIGSHCDITVATCRDEVTELVALGVPVGKVRVVPCGVDPQWFSPRPRPAQDAPPHGRPFRLLHIGRLVPRKGAEVAIEALARVPGAELVIAGGSPGAAPGRDPEVRRLRAVARRCGVTDRVRFAGAVPRPEVPALMRGCDLVLCPATYEPFGIVPLEAMACGVPVVASAVGGQLDTVADPATGRLVPPGDPAALAAAVTELLDDPAQRAACGAAGRRRVLTRYRWASVAEATERVYRDLRVRDPAPAVHRV
ncbi:glycosyltransferase [Streptomyces carpaticus]|uniref:Glycosyltransferase involved in cell wall bisynthesis n=2 Tax=Streptomyces harbinensis TaxID=1176198 RepID=A0A1I6P9Q0_9ACTN|nr:MULTISPECIES: glycosyltransferase [Streptomyces]UWM52179.1 glycosyltransferase [Streptomyces carpaticus]SFS36942.1 Glycosyltransferase involved in cell wall bisynthesis [Streptomyces harbinensis]